MGENPHPCDICEIAHQLEVFVLGCICGINFKWAINYSRYLHEWVKTHIHVTLVKWSEHQLEVFVLLCICGITYKGGFLL